MPRMSKKLSIEKMFGPVEISEFMNGTNYTGRFYIGKRKIRSTGYESTFVDRCYLVNVDTSQKDEDGYYVVEKLAGPFDYIKRISSNRIIVGKKNKIFIWDQNAGKIWARDDKASIEYLDYLAVALGGKQKRFLDNEEKVNKAIFNESLQRETLFRIFFL